MPVAEAAVVAEKLAQYLKDWEKVKCRLGGRRLRTACTTVSTADVPAFRSGQIAQYRVNRIAEDFQRAWKMTPDGNPKTLEPYGISYADLADVHLNNFVPQCLAVEAGRHTCHPEEEPGLLFNQQAHFILQDQIASGKLRWKGPPRGGSGGDGIGLPDDSEKAVAGLGLLAVVGLAVFLIARS